jgi:hypothetical protein
MSDRIVDSFHPDLLGCHILKYEQLSSYSITRGELSAIPLDIHTYVCDKTIQFGAHCLIVVHTDESNSKIHTLYEMPILSDQTRDYINMLVKNHPDLRGATIYAYFN